MQILMNGQPLECDQGLTLRQLLVNLNLFGQRIAVERNAQIVSKSQYDRVMLVSGDVLEVIEAVGGG